MSLLSPNPFTWNLGAVSNNILFINQNNVSLQEIGAYGKKVLAKFWRTE
jgi:hypothetical protein